MDHSVKIAGKEVILSWTQERLRSFGFRASKIGANPAELFRDFRNPLKAEYAVTSFLWLLLPDEEYRKYPLPDDLIEAIDPEDAAAIFSAVVGIIALMSPSAEKKSSSRKSPSPVSS